MTDVKSTTAPELIPAFQSLDTDQQLALFYFIYQELGTSITPAVQGASIVSPEMGEGLFNQVKDLSHAQQLYLQQCCVKALWQTWLGHGTSSVQG